MAMLQKPLDELPPFASYLNFELFKTDANSYLVKINYNGKSITIPGCNAKICTLKQFMKIADHTQGVLAK